MKSFRKIKKFVSVFLIFSLSLSILPLSFLAYPNEVSAQNFPVFPPIIDPPIPNLNAVPVYDATVSGQLFNFQTISANHSFAQALADAAIVSKEVGLVPGVPYIPPADILSGSATSWDGIGLLIIKPLIQQFTQSLVGWIDSGFQGQPAFVTDPGSFLLDVADTVAGDFIEGSELGFLCEPFELEVRAILNYNYNIDFEDKVSCRLSEVLNNVENFARFTGGDFLGGGGWDSWFQIIQTRNNIYGTYISADLELRARIGERTLIDEKLLDWGDGFLSFQECEDPPGAPLSQCLKKGPIKTPGATIETGLSDILGSDLRQWELADEFDKIIAALINQLVNSAMRNFLGGR